MPSINFNDWLDANGYSSVEAFNAMSASGNGAALLSNFQSEVNSNFGYIANTEFWDVLAELQLQVAANGFAEINGYVVDFESFGQDANFVAADFSIDTLTDVAFLHFTRNILTDYTITYEDIIANADQYVRVSDIKAEFHQVDGVFGDTVLDDNANNVKWVSLDGTQEYIFRETENGWELVTDAFNQGSYNYSPDGTTFLSLGHMNLDVDPWEFFGNFIDDPSDRSDRDVYLPIIVGGLTGGANGEPDYDVEYVDVYPATNNTLSVASPDYDPEVQYWYWGNAADNLILSGPNADQVFGSTGNDTLSFILSDTGVTANLELGNAYDGWGLRPNAGDGFEPEDKYETIVGVENLVGSHGADIFFGDGQGNELDGRGGVDRLYGQGGDDTLIGGAGNDFLDGGEGTDTAQFSGSMNDYFGTGLVNGNVMITHVNGGSDVLANIEVLQFDDGQTDIYLNPLNVLPPIAEALFADSSIQLTSLSYTGAETALELLTDGHSISDIATGSQVVGMDRGVFLSSGGSYGTQNTSSSFTVVNGQPGDSRLDDAATAAYSGAGGTNDAALIEFSFDAADLGNTPSITFDLYFGSDEYPEYVDSSFVDIAVVMVNGVNYALFNNDSAQPLSITGTSIGTPGNFIDNTGGLYDIEYDGFSVLLTVVAPIQEGVNEVVIGIADTGDSSYDSGLFIGNVQGSNFNFTGSFIDVSGTLGNDSIGVNAAPELVTLGGGSDTVSGTPDELNGDVIAGWSDDDELTFEGTSFGFENLTITMGSAILEVDLDGDGNTDVTTTLEGDFTNAEFSLVTDANGTTLSATGVIPYGKNETGSAGDDVMEGTDGADTLIGSSGNDQITGGAADDQLTGGTGNDTLTGGEGGDTLSGGDGDDALFGQASADVIMGGIGNDNVGGGDGNDTIHGDDGDDMLGGGQDDDWMTGGAGNDTLGGGFGNDTLEGGNDDDVVAGGAGDDSLDGNDGADNMGGSFGADIVNGGIGNDNLGGGSGQDTISGGDGDDSIGGGEASDRIYGGAGNDFLAGGGRDDTILGEDGDDRINGGLGSDQMQGGAGADLFIFNGYGEGDADRITDFEIGIDAMRLTGVDKAPGSGLQGYLDALDITQTAEGAELHYGTQTILLLNVDAGELTLDHFTFL